jgi:dTDP-4-amino-4,6-dideoxygalactose transaminase
MGAKHALMVNAGSSALTCALIGAGVGEGDEVIALAARHSTCGSL